MIIYEVNLLIDSEIEQTYRVWLDAHVREILALPGFIDAEILEEKTSEAGKIALSVRYRLSSQADLDSYLADHAPRLRAEGQNKFGGRFSASRRILRSINAFN